MKNDVADRLVSAYVLSADDPIVESIRDIDIVCTALGDEPALAEFDICYVPQLHEVEDYSIQTNIDKHATNNNNNLWETYLTSLNLSLLHDKMETINSHFTEIGRMK